MASKRHDQIRVGDIVRGADREWWKVTNITVQSDGFRQFDTANNSDGRPGYLSGPAWETRQTH